MPSPAAVSAAPEARPLPWWRLLRDVRVWIMLALGFAAGLPLLLIFSSLSLWLGEAGVERRAVTFFSWAALAYSFKFVWAPLVDRLPLPWLTRRLGRRRSWLLLAQLGVVLAIIGMAATDPAAGPAALARMAAFAVLLGFASATQDIVIDAYRIELAPPEQQGWLSAAYVAGYRLGMVVTGAGVLLLAAAWGSAKGAYVYEAWAGAYAVAALTMGLGVLTTLLAPEPPVTVPLPVAPAAEHARLLAVFALAVTAFVAVFWAWGVGYAALGWQGLSALPALGLEALRLAAALAAAFALGALLVRAGLASRAAARQTWVEPVLAFFARHGVRDALLLLALIGTYRLADILLGVISNVFYQDLGFSKPDIAAAVKTFGVVVSIAGGFVGGLLAAQLGVLRALWWGALLAALTNLAFVALALAGPVRWGLYAVVAADNLAAGLASAAFVAFLSSLTQVRFTAVQYAIFSSLMTLLPKALGGYAGTMVDALGYPGFFVLTTVLGLPVLLLVGWVRRRGMAAA
ncbi:MAG: permease [Tepidimonas sp.]|uniref:AmpG family muropeptide MFS transporter n=1 Tax=Tepidimonas sp. TaxID=2002775 RepID=UPI00298F0F01|nr:MFS transporter [Tepidimonas sp.]MDW8336935.1 permease [Tepidimonas sp.]